MTSRSWIRQLFARTSRTARKSMPPRRPAARPGVEFLEDRLAPATFTLGSLLDDGSTGTLRDAITRANANGQSNTIIIPGSLALFFAQGTITLAGTELPVITSTLSIASE